jgi:prepilin-type N-terminal cleavage/methylation domain-containing protein
MARTGARRGFTLVELAVVVAIVCVVAALAGASLARLRPRAHLANTASELQALLRGARQAALASGRDVVVMFFPSAVTPEGTGRVIVYEDGTFDFFSDAPAVNFDDYDPLVLRVGARGDVLSTLDFPASVGVGPANGLGASATLNAPYDGIVVSRDCSFCRPDGDRRGAVRFDGRGRATFHQANGAPAPSKGASVSVTSPELGGDTRMLIITSSTGAVRAVSGG